MKSSPAWIVVVEDNAPDVFLIREALNEEGLFYRLESMPDGDTALHFLDDLDANPQALCPDLFLIDLNLPKRSGGEVLSRVRASHRCRKTPVIIISSSDAPRDRDLARSFGAKLYFRKPTALMDFMKIGGCIRAVLAGESADIPRM